MKHKHFWGAGSGEAERGLGNGGSTEFRISECPRHPKEFTPVPLPSRAGCQEKHTVPARQGRARIPSALRTRHSASRHGGRGRQVTGI